MGSQFRNKGDSMTMVQIQCKEKHQVIDLGEVPECLSSDKYAELQIWERFDRRKISLVTGLLQLGVALLVALCVIKLVTMMTTDDTGTGDVYLVTLEQEPKLSLRCTFDTGASPWTKKCSCDGMCGCTVEVKECLRYDGCAHVYAHFQELWRVGRCD